MANKTQLSQKDYRQLGKAVERIIQKDYVDLAMHWPRLIKVSFIRGVAAGFGGVLGATIVVALLIWLLSLFDQLPFMGKIFEGLREIIKR